MQDLKTAAEQAADKLCETLTMPFIGATISAKRVIARAMLDFAREQLGACAEMEFRGTWHPLDGQEAAAFKVVESFRAAIRSRIAE